MGFPAVLEVTQSNGVFVENNFETSRTLYLFRAVSETQIGLPKAGLLKHNLHFH